MTCIQFNYSAFILYYTQFANTTAYPQSTLQLYWNRATSFISNNTWSGGLTQQQRVEALNLMTAHIAVLSDLAAAGEDSGVVVGATIDKVNVQLQPPPEGTKWQHWLNQTIYGQQLLALLDLTSAGGFFVGGSPTLYTLRR